MDVDGTISPATIYQHYESVVRRLFRELDDANADADPSQSQSQSQNPPPLALDWPLSVEGVDADLTLDELPVSPNSLLPEYQLTQEWFERVVEELRQAEESKAIANMAAAASGEEEDVGIGVGAHE